MTNPGLNLALTRIREMDAYRPPLDGRATYQGRLLDLNERTTPSRAALGALSRALEQERLQIYPEYGGLEAQIAEYMGVNPAQVLLTNGVDQAIDVIFRTFVDIGDIAVVPEPAFALYSQAAALAGGRLASPQYLGDDLTFPVEVVQAMAADGAKLIVITNPNNPTGTLTAVEIIEKIAKGAPDSLVFVDEAYGEFARSSAVELIERYPNIVLTRTFSKAFGLAGLRIGYVIANEMYINEMTKVRGPYPVNVAAYAAASASLSNLAEMHEYVREVMDIAKPMVEEFFRSNGIPFYKSAGNFILFRPHDVESTYVALRNNGIRVRKQTKAILAGTLRVTIGTANHMEEFVRIYERNVLKTEVSQKYAFLDRDGTLIFEPQDDFLIDHIDKLKILDGVIDGLCLLKNNGYRLIMVSNQDGLGTDALPNEAFQKPHEAMLALFEEEGIFFEEVFICPHYREDNCECRKPGIGMLTEFLNTHSIDREQSFVCGDRHNDKGLAANLGIRFLPTQTNGNFLEAIATALPHD